MTLLPLRNRPVSLQQQGFDLRPEKPKHVRYPQIGGPAGPSVVDFVFVHHTDDIGSLVPGFGGDPPVGGEEADGLSARIHANADDMAERVGLGLLRTFAGEVHGSDFRG